MSVMQRLRAIRERIATQVGEDIHPAEGLEVSGNAGAHEDRDNVRALHGGDTATGAVQKQAPASMWDMVHDTDPDIDADPRANAEGVDEKPPLEQTLAKLRSLDSADAEPPAGAKIAAHDAAPVQPAVAPVAETAPALAVPVSYPVAAASAASSEARSDNAPAETPDDKQQRRTGRVKTRLLGFEHASGKTVDVFEKADEAPAAQSMRFPVGWMVIVEGPGLGTAIALQTGVSQIGRDEDQAIQLDFGDTSVSRANHAAMAFDEEERAFFIGHGGKSNLVRLNGKPLLSTEQVRHGDTVKIGETTLRLVALCGDNFSWLELSDPQKNANG